jgi:hypothetical protein
MISAATADQRFFTFAVPFWSLTIITVDGVALRGCAPTAAGRTCPPPSMRRQPGRIVEGGKDGGYKDAFEVACCDCGDHPYWDYSGISLSLQRIRGPYTTMAAALAAYDEHLGLTTARRRS